MNHSFFIVVMLTFQIFSGCFDEFSFLGGEYKRFPLLPTPSLEYESLWNRQIEPVLGQSQ